MIDEMLTLANDSTGQIVSWVLFGGGVFGATVSAVAGITLENVRSSTLTRTTAIVSAFFSVGVMVSACVVQFTDDANLHHEEREQATSWLAETHDLTFVPDEEGQNTVRNMMRSETVLAVDSEGERHAVKLVPYESELDTSIEGESFYLVDAETEEPYVNNDDQ